MWLKLCIVALVVVSVTADDAGGGGDGEDANKNATQSPPPEDPMEMEAQFISYNASAGPDTLPQMDFMQRTKRNYRRILNHNAFRLVHYYCGSLARDLVIFGQEHAEAFGVTNATVPNFDVYDVAQRILLAFENLPQDHQAFRSVNHSLVQCKENTHAEREGTPARQQSLWILGCITNTRDAELEVLSRSDVRALWHFNVAVDAALDHLHEILRCPQLMTPLAVVQMDAEYKRDGVKKAHTAGAMSQERMEYLLAKLRLPTLGDVRKQMVRKTLERQQAREKEEREFREKEEREFREKEEREASTASSKE